MHACSKKAPCNEQLWQASTQPLLKDNSNPPSIVAWLRKEVIVLEVDVSFADCVVEDHVVAAEDDCEGEAEFCFCEAGGVLVLCGFGSCME